MKGARRGGENLFYSEYINDLKEKKFQLTDDVAPTILQIKSYVSYSIEQQKIIKKKEKNEMKNTVSASHHTHK
jgi:hypothetical protein